MKFTNSVAVTLATAGSLAAAHGHHGHAHFHKRAVDTETVDVPGPTVYDFVVMNPSNTAVPQSIGLDEACAGLADHKLEWLGAPVPAACATSTSTPTPTPTTAAAQVLQETSAAIDSTSSSSSSTSTVEPTSSSTSTVDPTTIAPTTSSTTNAPVATAPAPVNTGATGINAAFPDGQLDCSIFPSEYGAVSLDYLGLGGWSGIQYVSLVNELVTNIVTAVTGDTCTEGSMCSYACPAGYQKSQWPTTQGSTGQSVGGLQCKNGKLWLTNSGLSKQICIPGTGGVNVRNEMSQGVAVCRTDYPGTESETIPLAADPGGEFPLTCPNGAEYFMWQGQSTSAQYYVNNKGVSTQQGCQWGDGSLPIGNWAPMNFGVGYSNGATWLSMFKNEPTTNANLDFAVKLIGDDLSDNCSYDGKGNFYNNAGLITTGNGCTVSLSGNCIYMNRVLTRSHSAGQLLFRQRLLRFHRVSVFRCPRYLPSNHEGPRTRMSFSVSIEIGIGVGARGASQPGSSVRLVYNMVCYSKCCLLLCILTFMCCLKWTFGREMKFSLSFQDAFVG